VCIIGHGSSNDRAIFNGIRVAYELAVAGTNQRIEAEFASRPVRIGHAAIPHKLGEPAANPDATIQ